MADKKSTRWNQWIFERLLVLAGIGAGLAPVFAFIGARVGGLDVKVGGGGFHPPGPPIRGLRVDEAVYTFAHPTFGEQLLATVGPLATGIVVIAVTRLLFLVVRSLRSGDPFNRQNSIWLRRAGVVAAVGGVAASLVAGWAHGQLVDRVPHNVPVFNSTSVTFTSLTVGLALLVIAEVFRRGAEMREELAEVV